MLITCHHLLIDPDGYQARCNQPFTARHTHKGARESVAEGLADPKAQPPVEAKRPCKPEE